MLVFDVTFRAAGPDAAMSFVAALGRSGQRADPWPAFVADGGDVRCRLTVPAADALEARHDSSEAAEARKAVGRVELIRVGEAAESAGLCGCASRPFLLLFTTFIEEATPLRCGGCWGLVPLYAVPSPRGDGDQGDLLGWAARYQALDSLYMQSGACEGFAYAQVSSRGSLFGAETMALCKGLEERIRIPVYAYLNRPHGPVLDACPECGQGWEREDAAGPWVFRCEPCRVVFPEPVDLGPPPAP